MSIKQDKNEGRFNLKQGDVPFYTRTLPVSKLLVAAIIFLAISPVLFGYSIFLFTGNLLPLGIYGVLCFLFCIYLRYFYKNKSVIHNVKNQNNHPCQNSTNGKATNGLP